MEVGLFAKRLELPRALFKREPYVVATVVTENDFLEGKQEVRVETKPLEGINKASGTIPIDVEILAPVDPGSFIRAHVAVMESDAGYRRAGTVLDAGREGLSRTSLGKRLFAGIAASSGVAGAILLRAAGGLIQRLKKAGDDVLLEFELTLTDEEDFRSGHFWFEKNKRCELMMAAGSSIDVDFEPMPLDPPPAEVVEAAEKLAETVVEHADAVRDGALSEEPEEEPAVEGFAFETEDTSEEDAGDEEE